MMKSLILFMSSLIMVSGSAHAANLFDCTISDNSWQQAFVITAQMDGGEYDCQDRDGNKLSLNFSGGGASLSISDIEAFKVVFLGGGNGVGTYYGERIELAGLLGANEMVAVGSAGVLAVVGVDLLGVGVDVSAVQIVVTAVPSAPTQSSN